jgi:hypothetical protein
MSKSRRPEFPREHPAVLRPVNRQPRAGPGDDADALIVDSPLASVAAERSLGAPCAPANPMLKPPGQSSPRLSAPEVWPCPATL